MRLIDIVLRQGHLSEQALIDAIVQGDRPRHIDQCDICAERAVELARWMDELQADAADLSDSVFTPERLAAQQQQIVRRLQQLDQPSRVIAFPAASRAETPGVRGRRVAVSWVGVAAAAGLILGVVGGQISARLATQQPVPAPVTATATDTNSPIPTDVSTGPVNDTLLAEPYETISFPSQDVLDSITPQLQKVSVRR